jgi:hypothetical protein
MSADGRELKRRVHSRVFSRSARRCRNVSTAASPSINSPTLGLSKAFRDVGGDGFALSNHPVLKIELLADSLEGLIENLAGILIRSRPDRQVDDGCCSGFRLIVMGPFEDSSFAAARLPYLAPSTGHSDCCLLAPDSFLPILTPDSFLLAPSFGHYLSH